MTVLELDDLPAGTRVRANRGCGVVVRHSAIAVLVEFGAGIPFDLRRGFVWIEDDPRRKAWWYLPEHTRLLSAVELLGELADG